MNGLGSLTFSAPRIMLLSAEREYPITMDSTSLAPPSWWHVPGITSLIWTMDPISSEAFRTTDIQTLNLKPGEYRFGTFTFDFSFRVTPKGVLEFAKGLD